MFGNLNYVINPLLLFLLLYSSSGITVFGFDFKSTNTRQTRMTHRTATSETNIADKQTTR